MKNLIKEKIIWFYFSLLFVFLLGIFLPSFFDPPRSDNWPVLYFFHNLDDYHGNVNWLHIMNYDPWTRIRFYPLAHFTLYLQYIIFGANYMYIHHITNFVLYFISIVLLYKFAMVFCQNKLLVMSFLGVFAFLFSHFDIVAWALHVYVILAFCLYLSGFLIYIKYLRSEKSILLAIVAVLFITGMLLYESFVLWPLTIIFLSYIDGISKGGNFKPKIKKASYLSVIGVVYFIYTLFFFFSRKIGTYASTDLPWKKVFSFDPLALIDMFFNIIYNGIVINLIPFFATPLSNQIEDNINMGGVIDKVGMDTVTFRNLMISGGIIMIFILVYILVYLFRKKRTKTIKVTLLFYFLLLSELLILFHCRSLTNNYAYMIQQFRYQYVPNAVIMILAAYLLENLLKPRGLRKKIICLVMLAVFLMNILITRKHVLLVNKQLTPLRHILLEIKEGIDTGKIDQKHKLYIEDGITQKLPHLCWNRQMGDYFMIGTYQWIFNKKEVEYFSFTPKEAYWIITKDDLRVKRKQF